MRVEVNKVVSEQIITLPEVAELLNIQQALVYRFVVTDKVCQYGKVGKSHIVIDREDVELIKQRLNKSAEYKANRKKVA